VDVDAKGCFEDADGRWRGRGRGRRKVITKGKEEGFLYVIAFLISTRTRGKEYKEGEGR
jgi:hypothetical protein